MGVASAVSIKVINLFFIMLVGMLLRKVGIIGKRSTSSMSSLLLNVTNPLLIICALQRPYDPVLARHGLIILIASVVVHLAVALLSKVIYLGVKSHTKRRVYRMATIFTNCGFLGFPVCQAMCAALGDENGLFYGVFYNIFFNLFCWTYGVIVVNGGQKIDGKFVAKKILLNPALIATVISVPMYMLSITIPPVISEGMNYIANMTFPLSMLIIGSLFCEIKVKEIFSEASVYFFLAVKLILLPLAVIYACRLLGLSTIYSYVITIMTCVPTGSVTAIMADYYGADSRLAAKCVSFSTVLSVITIPLMIMIAGLIL